MPGRTGAATGDSGRHRPRCLRPLQELEPQAKRLGIAAEPLVAEEIGNAGRRQLRGDGECFIQRPIGDMADENRKTISPQVPRAELVPVPVDFENPDLLVLERFNQRLAAGRHRDHLPGDRLAVFHSGGANVLVCDL